MWYPYICGVRSKIRETSNNSKFFVIDQDASSICGSIAYCNGTCLRSAVGVEQSRQESSVLLLPSCTCLDCFNPYGAA